MEYHAAMLLRLGYLRYEKTFSLREAVHRILLVTGEKAIRLEVLNAVRETIGSEFPDLVQGQERQSKERCVLITGASGSIGSHLLSQLGSELKVVLPNTPGFRPHHR